MKIYLAGGSSELELVSGYMTRVRELGHVVTLDWTEIIRAVGEANPREATDVQRHTWATVDTEGIFDADLFWLLIPAKPSIGCWVELGYATGDGTRTRCIVSGDWRASIFTSLAHMRFDAHLDAMQWIAKGCPR